MKPEIQVERKNSLIDEFIKIAVIGLQPGEEIELQAEMKDDLNRVWSSAASFTADNLGQVDLTKMSPKSGDYSGCHSDGLLFSMVLKEPCDFAPPIFMTMSTASQDLTLSLFSKGILLDQQKISLDFVNSNIEMTNISESFVGKYFRPKDKSNLPAVLVIGGSSGGFMWSEQTAALLSSRGFAALSIAYFDFQGMYGLPNSLSDIPMEYFKSAIDWLKEKAEVNSDKIGVVGISKGGEASLLLGSIYNKDIKSIVSFVPSSHIFEGIVMDKKDPASSWSYEGKTLNFIPYPANEMLSMNMDKLKIRELHDKALEQAPSKTLEESRIPVEKIQCPVMLISSEKDATWPSDKMSYSIVNDLKDADFSFETHHLNFQKAGHVFLVPNLPPFIDNPEVNLCDSFEANNEAWREMLSFLDRNLR